MAYVIAIANEKGGVAKTTTALSLGAVFTELGYRVLLIDLDPQANLTLSLGVEPTRFKLTSEILFHEQNEFRKACYQTFFSDLDLIPANSGLVEIEQTLTAYLDPTVRLRNTIKKAVDLPYEMIFFDCPPSMGIITANALTASDLLIIPTQAEYFSAYALRNMMTSIRQVREKENPGLAYRILITLLDQRNRTHRDIREQLERTFGEGVLQTTIEIDTKLRESPILGLPITQYRPNCRGAIQYRNLAEELVQYVKQTNQEAA